MSTDCLPQNIINIIGIEQDENAEVEFNDEDHYESENENDSDQESLWDGLRFDTGIVRNGEATDNVTANGPFGDKNLNDLASMDGKCA